MSSNIVLMIAGIIRMRVLIEGGPYMRKYGTYCQLGFSSEIEVAQLGSARLGSSWKIPAWAHHYHNTKIEYRHQVSSYHFRFRQDCMNLTFFQLKSQKLYGTWILKTNSNSSKHFHTEVGLLLVHLCM